MKNRLKVVFVALFGGLFMSTAAVPASTLSGKVSGGKGVSVVYIEAIAGKTFPPPTEKLVVDQKGLMFQPHVSAAQVGSTVEFLNSDTVAHNIFWPAISGNKRLGHNLGTWPSGQKRAFKFDNPGVVPLLCNVHSEMSGFLIVTPTPYFAASGEDGSYKIANVADGQYTVSAWREGLKVQTKPVKVAGDTVADFSLK